jgi:hypothetical protein
VRDNVEQQDSSPIRRALTQTDRLIEADFPDASRNPRDPKLLRPAGGDMLKPVDSAELAQLHPPGWSVSPAYLPPLSRVGATHASPDFSRVGGLAPGTSPG